MSSNVYWLQCGGCGGDTWSLFNAESPNVVELFNALDINLLWHPSISIGDRFEQLEPSMTPADCRKRAEQFAPKLFQKQIMAILKPYL